MLRPALFLDRDDTLIDTTRVTADTAHPGDIVRPEQVVLLPGVAEGLGKLQTHRPEMALIVVSNQGGVARGHCTIADVEACNRRLNELLWDVAGVRLTAAYFCPYHPKGTLEPYNMEHAWRKPGPGMLLAAAADHGLDLARSWMIGDAPRDIDAALAAGLPREQTLLIAKPGEVGAGSMSFEQAISRVASVQ